MTIAGFRKSRLSFVTVVLTLGAYLATLLPSTPARAAPSDAVGTVDVGSGGSASLAGPTPGGNDGAALATVDLATGSARSSYPFLLPQARGEAQPSLGLRYNSSSGLGFAGMGWTLDLPSIVRRGKAGIPRFTDSAISAPTTLPPGQSNTDLNTDDYYFDGQLLIPVATGDAASKMLPAALVPVASDQWAAFRCEVDDGARYFFNGHTWVRQTKSGHLIQFGYPLDSGSPCVELGDSTTVQTFPQPTGWAPNPIYRWNLARDSDATGNTVYYAYDAEQQLFPSGTNTNNFGIQYLTDIYDTSWQTPTTSLTSAPPPTNTFAHHVRLAWSLAQYPGLAPTSSSIPAYAYSPIWKALPYAQLSTVDVTSATASQAIRLLVRRYQLSYTYNDTLTRAYMNSVQEVGDCLQSGAAIAENGGIVGSDPATVARLSTCIRNEGRPASTYAYWGVGNSTPRSPQLPQIFSKHSAYNTYGPGRILADFDGDAVAELVTSNNGFGTSPSLGISGVNGLFPACNFSCTTDVATTTLLGLFSALTLAIELFSQDWLGAAEHVVNLAVNGLPMPPPNCSGCLVWGPTTEGVTIGPPPPVAPKNAAPVWTQLVAPYTYGDGATGPSRKLTSMQVDDALWAYSILGDWTSSGVLNVLDLPYLPVWGTGSGFGPYQYTFDPNIQPTVSAAQFINVETDFHQTAQLQLQQLTLPQNDINYLQVLNGTQGNEVWGVQGGAPPSPVGVNGPLNPASAIDVDGDGLPDIGLIGSVKDDTMGNKTGRYNPYFSTRDRQGITHPFAAGGPQYCAPRNYDPTSWLPASATTSKRAFADIDGDGLADLVIFNKSGSNWSKNTAPFNHLNFDVLPGRGDGRFGVPMATPNGCASFSGGASYGGGFPSETPGGASESDMLGAHSFSTQSSVIRFGDLNGDGFTDYAVLDQDGLNVCLRYGATWETALYHCVKDATLRGTDAADNGNVQANILIGDLDGSGVNQVLYIPPTQGGTVSVTVNSVVGKTVTVPAAMGPSGLTTAMRVVTPSRSIVQGLVQREGLLQSVRSSSGAGITFDQYATVSSLNIGRLPVPAWVVTQSTTDNGLTGAQQLVRIEKKYAYGAPIYDPRDRAFVGFRSITETTANDTAFGSGQSPGTVVTTTFATQTCQYNSSCSNPNTDYSLIHASRGLTAFVEVSENNGFGAAGTKFSTTIMYYSFQTPYQGIDGRSGKSILSRNTDFVPWPEGSAQTSQTLSIQPMPGVGFPNLSVSAPAGSSYPDIRRSTLYDQNGNESLDVDAGLFGTDQPIARQFVWNLPPGDMTGWNWRITQELTGYGSGTLSPGGSGVREYDHGYDGLGRFIWTAAPIGNTATLTSNPSAMPNRPPPVCGNGGCSGEPVHLVIRQYDAYGNVTQLGADQNSVGTGVITPTTLMVTLGYDALFNQLMTDVFLNAPQGVLHASYSYDRGFAAQTGEVTPDGEATRFSYDDFGRVVRVDAQSPTSSMVTQKQVTASYDDTGPVRHIHFETADGYASNGGNPVPSAFVSHDRYIDGFGETLAAIDQIAATTAEGTQWLMSGIHSNYLNGRVRATYRPSPRADGSVPSRGTLPSGVTSPSGTSETFNYDGLGRATGGTDFLGHPWKNVYRTAALSVDSYDQEQTAGGHTTSYTTVTKDGHGRLVSMNRHKASSAGSDIVTTYDSYLATGEPTAITNGGETRTMAYDSLGRMVTNSEPNSGTWHYTYDFAGRLTGTSDARGCGQNIWYDSIGRMIAKDYVPCLPSTPQNNGQSQAAYSAPTLDSSGAFTGDGTEAFYTYDTSGRLADVKDLAKHDVYGYDSRGRVSTIQRSIVAPPANWVYGNFVGSTALSNRYASNVFTKTIGYDFSDRVISETSGATAPQVTAMGNTEARTYSFDGRLQSVALTGGSTPVNFLQSSAVGYATNGSVTATHVFGDAAATKAVSMYAVDGALSTYHLFRSAATQWPVVIPSASNADPSNLTQQADLLNLTILRDRVGNPKSIGDSSASTWPSGAAAVSQAFTYGNDYRLTSATSNAGNDSFVSPTAPEERPGYAYPNAFGTFQTQGILTRFKGQSFSYDVRGNFTSSTDDLNDFWDRSLGTQVCSATPVPPGQYTFGPDQLAKASEPSTSHYNTLQTATDPAGNVAAIVFPVGNTAAVFVYAYDEVGRLNWGQSWEPEAFIYDADGQRMLSVHGIEHGYTVTVFDSLVLHDATFANGAYQDDATTEQVYVGDGLGHVFYDSENVLPKVNNNQTHAFMTLGDGRGSGGVVVDHDSGEVVERMAYQPYGNPDADYRPARWNYNYERTKFGSHWDTKEIELVDMGARFYSPQLGRFMSPDPLWVHGLAGDPNPYEYANGNPIRYTDPTGLIPTSNGFDEWSFVSWEAPDSAGSDDGSGAGAGMVEGAFARAAASFIMNATGNSLPQFRPPSVPSSVSGLGAQMQPSAVDRGQAFGEGGGAPDPHQQVRCGAPGSPFCGDPNARNSFEQVRLDGAVVDFAYDFSPGNPGETVFDATRNHAQEHAVLFIRGSTGVLRSGPVALGKSGEHNIVAHAGPMRPGEKIIAFAHTHFGSNNSLFSRKDINNGDRRGQTTYLITPEGGILVYEPPTNSITIVAGPNTVHRAH